VNHKKVKCLKKTEKNIPTGCEPDYSKDVKHLFGRIDRRNRVEVIDLISQQIKEFTSKHRDNTEQIFKYGRLNRVETYQRVQCHGWQKESYVRERELYNDLEFYKTILHELIPDEHTLKVETEKEDRRQSKSKPKNDVRLKALMDILPEFVEQVRKIEGTTTDKGKLIELITGVNPTEAYQKIYTIKSLNITQEEQDRIDRFKAMIEQSETKN
jgi:hypothetical protein